MKIVIVGCGKIGKSIIQSLVTENHEIIAIDNNPSVIQFVTERYDIMGICASGTHFKTLADANVQDAELFLATTSADELNMLSCFIAKKMGAKHTVARIRGQEYTKDNLSFIKKELELSMIVNPDLMAAQAISTIIRFPSAVKLDYFTRRSFAVAEITVKERSVFDGAVVSSLKRKLDTSFLVCSVLRDGQTYIPLGDFVLHADDKIGILAVPDDMMKILRDADLIQKQTKNVMILGASRIALYLCELLEKSKIHITLIERDEARCNEIIDTLPDNVKLLCGPNNPNILSEEGLDDADAFVALTGLDEENILCSSYAVGRNVPKVISKVSLDDYDSICAQLGLDCVISPKRITAASVTRYARALSNAVGSRVETLYSLMNGTVEAIEFHVSQDFPKVGVPLKELSLKKDILIAGVLRGGETIIPDGNTCMMPSDTVIIITSGQILYDLSEILS